MFEFTAFYVYLSSSELVFDDVFDRGELFAVSFAIGALVQAMANLIASRLAPVIGTARLMVRVMTGYVGVGAALLVVTVAAGGHPNFWLWLALLWTLNAFHALVLTSANSLAMQPLAAFAGTGSGLIGTMSMMGAAIIVVVRRGDDPRIGHAHVAGVLRVRVAGRRQPVVGERWQPRTGRVSADPSIDRRHC